MTKKKPQAVPEHPLAAISRRLRVRVNADERLWPVLAILGRADAALRQGRELDAASFITEAEAAMDLHAGHARAWNILRVAPHMERRVRDTLADAGLQVYVPIETRWPKGYPRMTKAEKMRARPITRPLIPTYIFALLPDDEALDLARNNHAVREVTCFEGRPIRVPARELGAMVLFEACHEFDETWSPPGVRRGKRRGKSLRNWKGGERVKVVAGPFGGFMGDVLASDRDERVRVLVTLFGRATPIDLGEEEVQLVLEEDKLVA